MNMRDEQENSLTGIVLDDNLQVGLRELCSMCGCKAELIIEMVSEGIAEPQGSDPRQWRFTGLTIQRIQTAIRLQRDLNLNLAGAALALDLLDELTDLRRMRDRRLHD
jgi:chaperone modulatory protein CbpM